MRNIKAVFIKQRQSLIKMPLMLGQAVFFILFIALMMFFFGRDEPCADCIPAYVCAECQEERPAPGFGGMMTVMFVGMTLIGSASALVTEDKSTQNLRFMRMAGVKPFQYLIGTASIKFAMAMACVVGFAVAGRYFEHFFLFVLVTGLGALISILFGIAAGLSKYPALTTPISILLGMGPMLASFNDNLERWLSFTYTMQIRFAVGDLSEDLTQNFLIIGANGLFVLLLFIFLHRKGEMQW